MANQKIFTIATAHLDTQWTWSARDTVRKYLPDTLEKNFEYFLAYPGYRFNFEGAFRYALIKEYYPVEFEKVKQWHRRGRWQLAGATWESMDTLIPSSESLVRQVLYGSRFFKEHFSKAPLDLFLPDCFGFGFSLPTIARHAGLIGFSTQKLTWNKASAIALPFSLGKWHGSDGNFIFAALDPGIYESKIVGPLRQDAIVRDQLLAGDGVCLRYYGTGDIGGAPDRESVRNLQNDLGEKNGIEVLAASPEEAFQELPNKNLPSYAGDLIMTRHGVGCYTSRGILKRWNAHNERLADAAERANALAMVLGYPYPQEVLNTSWKRFLWHQFHDDLTGTSIPEAYSITHNDYIVSLNQFGEELTGGVRNLSAHLDTSGGGVPIIVYNPLAFSRKDLVRVAVPEGNFVVKADEETIPTQRRGDVIEFMAEVPGVGFRVYHVAPGTIVSESELRYNVTDEHRLSNEYYGVVVDEQGDIISIYDRELGQELLQDPIQLQLFQNNSEHWPSWEILYEDLAEPQTLTYSEVAIRLIDEGPLRLSLEVKRSFGHSVLRQTISLMAGVKRVEIEHELDWFEQASLLKLDVPLSLEPDLAAYDCGAGVVYRGINKPQLYEVPAKEFVSLSDNHQTISLLSDCKYGWDRPEKNRLRLSLVHTPKGSYGEAKQHLQDLGEHRFKVGITSHTNEYDQGTIEEAQRFTQPLRAFYSEPHPGELGRQVSLVETKDVGLKIMAVKRTEDSEKLLVRVQDMTGKSHADRRLTFAGRVLNVHEVSGQEEMIPGRIMIEGKSVRFDLNRNSMKSFVVQIESPSSEPPIMKQRPIDLLYNSDAYSPEGSQKIHPRFPMELVPQVIESRGIRFQVDPSKIYSTMRCEGQKVILPDGYRDMVFLAAALEEDTIAEFVVDGKLQRILMPHWRGVVGDWDDFAGGHFGGIKTTPIAWNSSHLHTPQGNQPFDYGYMFRFSLRGKKIFFPKDRGIIVFAATAVTLPDVEAADALYDQREERPTFYLDVNGGHGSGSYPLHAPLNLRPEVPEGSTFIGWEPNLKRMPAGDATVRAILKPLGINLARHAKVNSSGDCPIGEEPEQAATPGNSKWCSLAPGDKWIEIDLGYPRTINRYQVRHASSAGESEMYNTRSFEFQVDHDGWVAVDQVMDNTGAYTLRSIPPTTGQRFRLLITQAEQFSNRAARIYGLEIYGGEDV